MDNLLHLILSLPFLGFLASFLPRQELWISRLALAVLSSHFLLILGFSLYWFWQGATPLNVVDFSIYRQGDYNFFMDLLFDRLSLVFLFLGAFITWLVVRYSSHYLHKERGYKRFFSTLLFFYFGYTLTILSGNFETLFIGWEILGLSSFLLIAFYRLRYLPVKNALRVFTIYRIGDVGILLTLWMSHHFWHENITFVKFRNAVLVDNMLEHETGLGLFIGLMLLLAAAAKSAQLPFTTWLPRAMEGPTPSSAIFYGALSVHIGAFLLLRSQAFWGHLWQIQVLIIVLGASTALVASLIARVQASIKSQIAYSSAAQIGLIFIEIALGLELLALLHIMGNAFLRTYQLLLSPSVVTYWIREQLYRPAVEAANPEVRRTWRLSLYVLALREFNLEALIYRLVFFPLKKLRYALGSVQRAWWWALMLPLYALGLYLAYEGAWLSPFVRYACSIFGGLMALGLVVRAYNEQHSSLLAWTLIIFAHLWVDWAVSFNEQVSFLEAGIYLSGILVSGLLGLSTLAYMQHKEKRLLSPRYFQGLIRRYPWASRWFFLACLGLAGFPISSAFFGEDIILSHVQEDQIILAALISLSFIVTGIAIMRLYARLILGYRRRSYQEKADLSL